MFLLQFYHSNNGCVLFIFRLNKSCCILNVDNNTTQPVCKRVVSKVRSIPVHCKCQQESLLQHFLHAVSVHRHQSVQLAALLFGFNYYLHNIFLFLNMTSS